MQIFERMKIESKYLDIIECVFIDKKCFLVFFKAGLHLLVRKISTLSVKLFLFSYTQEAGHRLPAACGRDFWELAPFCPEGGREIGVIPCEAQRVQDEAEAVSHLKRRLGFFLQRGTPQ